MGNPFTHAFYAKTGWVPGHWSGDDPIWFDLTRDIRTPVDLTYYDLLQFDEPPEQLPAPETVSVVWDSGDIALAPM